MVVTGGDGDGGGVVDWCLGEAGWSQIASWPESAQCADSPQPG